MKKIKVEMEFPINISPDLLLSYLTISDNMEKWFCDKILVEKRNEYNFEWDGFVEKAIMIKNNEYDLVRFKFEEDEEENIPFSFEFRIDEDELTNDISLIVTEYQDADEVENSKLTWRKQIDKLKQILGAK